MADDSIIAVEDRVDFADVDSVIGVAAEAMEESADYLSVEELKQVAADLEIPPKFVQPAIAEVRRRRQARLEAEAKKVRRRKFAVTAVLGVTALFLLWALMSAQALTSSLNLVEMRRAQVTNVLERQVAVTNRWRGKADGPDKVAELAGAENRVRIERRRYDRVAMEYNNAASSFPASLMRGLFDVPENVPLSSEVSQW